MFGPGAAQEQLARTHLPSPFYRNFSLLFFLQPSSPDAGMVLAITDTAQQLVLLGVKLSALEGSARQVLFYYTEPGSAHRFALSVAGNMITLYVNCDADPHFAHFVRSPSELELEAGASVFVGHAGGADPDRFLVRASRHLPDSPGVIGDLKVVGDPRAAERHCEEEEEEDDDSDVASGDSGSGDEDRSPVETSLEESLDGNCIVELELLAQRLQQLLGVQPHIGVPKPLCHLLVQSGKSRTGRLSSFHRRRGRERRRSFVGDAGRARPHRNGTCRAAPTAGPREELICIRTVTTRGAVPVGGPGCPPGGVLEGEKDGSHMTEIADVRFHTYYMNDMKLFMFTRIFLDA
ncbi:hypothetical protein Z043_108578 [Scleropages formosus]|uniref:Thrombospondin-like N-terminal domain-containing protein n=1 Tax=Scleropages formosus TaxID=113540 RepID=A0A0N8K0K9_SCLFO|nr:hypothetical protein Z043_108578 [Scleropages formosus]